MTQVGSRALRPLLGLVLPPTTQGELAAANGTTISTTNPGGEVAEVCRQAEEAGADSLWSVDHLFWPHPIAEPLTTLAIAAASTSGPMLGTCVLQLPLRKAEAVAKQATALQVLSGGRFVLGVGVGIHEGEYRRAGVDYHRRGKLMDEGVAKLREAWGPDHVSDYVMEPSSTPVPIWFGGSSDAARRRTATAGDGWIPLFLTPDDYAVALAALRRETEEAGRDPDHVEAGVVVFARPGDGDAAARGSEWLSDLYRLPPKAFLRHIVAGSPDVCAQRLHEYVEAGARHLVMMVAGPSAVDNFSQLRAAFAPEERILTGSPA